MYKSLCGGLAATALFVAGCASNDVPPPRAELARAELAVEQAVTGEATEYAPLALREAREKLTGARDAVDDKDYRRAERLAKEAQVSAQLALSEAQAGRAQLLAKQNLQSIETLRQEIQRQQLRSEANPEGTR